jgi:Subtilase family
MRVLLAVAVATAAGVHEARAQQCPPFSTNNSCPPQPGPQSPGAPSDSNKFNPLWIVGAVVVGGLIAVLVGKHFFGDPSPPSPPITPPLPPGGGGMPPTTQLSIDPPPSPPRQTGGSSGGGTTVQALRRGFDLPPFGAPILHNECVLDISANVSIATLDAIAARHQMTRLETVDIRLTGRRLHRWRLDGGGSVADMIRAVSSSEPSVAGMQAQFVFTLSQTPPAQINGDQYAPEKLNLPEAHRLATGNRVLIAVIDSEVDASHPDLTGAISAKFDATDKARPHAHGTAMAGAIAGRRTVLGTAPQVRLLTVNAFSTSAREAEGTTFSILKGLDWAATQGARVVNMSFAGPADPRLQDALAKAYKKGLVLIAAAGNAGPNSPPLFPAADPNVIAVTATDIDDGLFPGANRGKHIAVAAPGVDVLVPAPDGAYQFTTGTSVAAAEVSGIAALLIERNPALKPADIRRILTSTAKDLGAKGHDSSFGSGLVNALRAVTAAGGRGQPGL